MLSNLEMTTLSYFGTKSQTQEGASRKAVCLFNLAYGRAMRREMWAKLTGKSNKLQSLPRHAAEKTSRHSGGIVTVPIDRIAGSEGRSLDFDAAFNPRQFHTRDRWMSIFIARRMGIPLPPIDLIKVGRKYYVRDGHHRLSVAKALGQLDIEARIVN